MSRSFQTEIRGLSLRPFMLRSDYQAWWLIFFNYVLIIMAFAIPLFFPHVLSYVVSIILLGNRQLGLGILMHDCAHNALFKSKNLNTLVGNWLCAAPIWAQFHGYQQYHLQHHAKAGTDQDPDYPNYRIYPVKRSSVLRKFARDLLGITGLKNFALVLLMHSGILSYDMAYKSTDKKHVLSVKQISSHIGRNLYRPLIMHSVFIISLYLLQHLALYALWWIAYFTTFALFSRIRNAAEHANVPNLLDLDPRKHARTVYASPLARLTVAPNHVNYHIEHHWLPQVPPYRLAALHRYLKDEGVLNNAEVLPSYWSVIRKLA